MKLRNKKTGEIGEIRYENHALYVDTDGGFTYWLRTIADFNEEWEDYKPADPLIKDKNIRKAVRAWAEVNMIKKALYAERPDRSLCLLTDMGEDDYNIDFVGWIPTLIDGDEYTIDELCGEKE